MQRVQRRPALSELVSDYQKCGKFCEYCAHSGLKSHGTPFAFVCCIILLEEMALADELEKPF